MDAFRLHNPDDLPLVADPIDDRARRLLDDAQIKTESHAGIIFRHLYQATGGKPGVIEDVRIRDLMQVADCSERGARKWLELLVSKKLISDPPRRHRLDPRTIYVLEAPPPSPQLTLDFVPAQPSAGAPLRVSATSADTPERSVPTVRTNGPYQRSVPTPAVRTNGTNPATAEQAKISARSEVATAGDVVAEISRRVAARSSPPAADRHVDCVVRDIPETIPDPHVPDIPLIPDIPAHLVASTRDAIHFRAAWLHRKLRDPHWEAGGKYGWMGYWAGFLEHVLCVSEADITGAAEDAVACIADNRNHDPARLCPRQRLKKPNTPASALYTGKLKLIARKRRWVFGLNEEGKPILIPSRKQLREWLARVGIGWNPAWDIARQQRPRAP